MVFSNYFSLCIELLYLSAGDTDSSDEDVSPSPDHKRHCSGRDQKQISTTCNPQTRSTSQPKYTPQTTSAKRPKTKNK